MPKKLTNLTPTIAELIELIRAAKESGLTKFKLGDFEAEIAPPQPPAPIIMDMTALPTPDTTGLDAASLELLGFSPSVPRKPRETGTVEPQVEIDPVDDGLFGTFKDGSPDGEGLN